MAAPRTTRTRKTAAAKPAAAKRTAAKPAAAKANGKTNGRTAAPKQTDTAAAPKELTGLDKLAADAQRAAKAKRTRDESTASGETRSCAVCTKEKPINKFPTTSRNKDGQMGRANTCRECRDAARASKKAG